jgi:hypothetical protein
VANRTTCLFALACLLFTACRKPHASPAFDYATDVGVAVLSANRSCLDIANATLTAGQRLQFVTASTPQTTGELEITPKLEKSCTAGDPNNSRSHYEFTVVRGSLAKSVPAFALVNFNGSITIGSGGVTADLDRNGQPEFFRSCTSSEGVHLTIWSGKPVVGQRRWHDYYYLGYDVDADCSIAEMAPDRP